MGMFDTVTVRDDSRFSCSDGHLLYAEEFQTKDLGCTMGFATVFVDNDAQTRMHTQPGSWDTPVTIPLLGRFEIYCDCHQCPAFVQVPTGNVCPVSVEFMLEIVDNVVRKVTRVSPGTAEFLADEPKKPYMVGCEGPMSFEAAELRAREIRRIV
jgi:hypothetical protein